MSDIDLQAQAILNELQAIANQASAGEIDWNAALSQIKQRVLDISVDVTGKKGAALYSKENFFKKLVNDTVGSNIDATQETGALARAFVDQHPDFAVIDDQLIAKVAFNEDFKSIIGYVLSGVEGHPVSSTEAGNYIFGTGATAGAPDTIGGAVSAKFIDAFGEGAEFEIFVGHVKGTDILGSALANDAKGALWRSEIQRALAKTSARINGLSSSIFRTVAAENGGAASDAAIAKMGDIIRAQSVKDILSGVYSVDPDTGKIAFSESLNKLRGRTGFDWLPAEGINPENLRSLGNPGLTRTALSAAGTLLKGLGIGATVFSVYEALVDSAEAIRQKDYGRAAAIWTDFTVTNASAWGGGLLTATVAAGLGLTGPLGVVAVAAVSIASAIEGHQLVDSMKAELGNTINRMVKDYQDLSGIIFARDAASTEIRPNQRNFLWLPTDLVIQGGNDGSYVNGTDQNDFLLGGDGDDVLLGGNGTDIIRPGLGVDYVSGAGIDSLDDSAANTVSYDASFHTSPPPNVVLGIDPGGIEITFAPFAEAPALSNVPRLYVHKNGYDEDKFDTLDNIQRIIGTQYTDRLTFGTTLTGSAGMDDLGFGFLKFDLRGSDFIGQHQDVVDFSALDRGVFFDARTAIDQTTGRATAKSGRVKVLPAVQSQLSGGGLFGWIGRELDVLKARQGPNPVNIYNANEVIGTRFDDILFGSSYQGRAQDVADGPDGLANDDSYEGFSVLKGGDGSDALFAAGYRTEMYGGAGSDMFSVGNGTIIEDGDTTDRVFVGGLPLFGGIKPIWMKANYAIPQMFGGVANAFPVIGAEIFSAAAIFLDAPYMSIAHFATGSDGSLAIRYGMGDHWAQTIVRDYKLDLDTGKGSAGLTVFAAERGDHVSRAEFGKFVNLALMAGFGRKLSGYDPIVLDLNGNGIELWTAQNSPVYRDLGLTGFAERTGWARGGDGILVRDLDGNGSIDTAAEMFAEDGDAGYAGLAAYDTNADGVIDSADAGYGALRVWVDANEDGQTDASELKTLTAAGVASLSLATSSTENDAIAGSTVTARSTFSRTDGSTGHTAEVTFTVDPTQAVYSGDKTVSAAAAALPQFLGIGRAADLRVVASHDATLLGMLQDFVSTTDLDLASLTSQATEILLRWTRADSVAATPIGDFDARRLAALETLAGTDLAPRIDGVPSDVNTDELNNLWADTVKRFTLRLAIQGPLAGMLGSIDYLADRDTLLVDSSNDLADAFASILTTLPATAPNALAAWADWAPLLSALVEDMSWRDDSGPIAVDDGFALAALQKALADSGSPLTLTQLAPTLGYTHVKTGTIGDDVLQRDDSGNFTFVSSGGADTFNGGGGEDFYLIGADAGTVTINDVEANPQGDTLQFASLNRADVAAVRDGADLVLTSLVDNTVVRVVGQFADVARGGGGTIIGTNRGIESIVFADGTLLETGLGQISALVGTGGAGNDTMIGTNQSDYLEGGKGNDILRGGDDGDFYYYDAGDGDDTISDVMSNPLVKAADMLMFGKHIAPADLAFSRTADGDDLLITVGAGEGASIITVAGQFAYNVLGTDQAFATTNAIELFVFEGFGETYSNTDLQQLLIGQQTTDGNDTTYGFGSNDTLFASAGNDLLIGLDGADTYYWGSGVGNDTIDERARFIDVNVGLGGITLSVEADTVQFSADIDPANLIFTRNYDTDDLTITNSTTGETLTVDSQFNSFQTGVLGAQWFDRIEWFAFADNSAYSWQDIEAMVTTGSAGNDRLRGDILADRMDGGAGNDLLSGGGGGDTYVFNAGDGHDTVFDDNQTLIGDGFLTADQTIDAVELGAGIDPADVTFSRDGSAITLTFGASGDAITLRGQDDYIQTGVFGAIPTSRIEQVKFHDGTVWTWQDVNQKMIAAQTTANDDVAEGFTLSDRFEKSAGDDIMRGGDSGDTYVFGLGAGHDRIEESVTNVLYGDDDSVEFDNTVSVADVSVARDGNDLILTLTAGDTLRVAGEFDLQTLYTWTDVENFRFADGTVWSKADIQHKLLEATAGNDHLVGFYSADDLDGGAGDDILEGGDGSDTYHFDRGYGHDEIRESVTEVNVGDFDQVVFGPGLVPDDLTIARDGNDLIFTVTDTGETLRVTGQFNFGSWFAWNDVELFTFADGTQWSDLDIAARLTGGTAGDDHLIGTFRSDTLDGKAGNDLLEGGDGSDIYVFGRGYGHDEIRESLTDANLGEDDEVRFGQNVALSDLTFTRDGDNLIIAINGTDDTLTLTGEFVYSYPYTWNDVERFTFADGSYVTKEQVTQFVLTGTSGNDHIIGFGSNDTLDGGAGDDILEGYDGSDTYRFGVGDGHDTVYETLTDGRTSENDTLAFKAGVLPGDVTVTRDGQDAIFTLTSGDSIRVVGQFNEGYNEFLSYNDVEQAVFADGTVWDKVEIDRRTIHTTAGDDLMLGSRYAQTYDGGAGSDTIYAGNNNDTLIGGTGNDHLEGDGGDDTYIYNIGDGDDVIHDYNYGNDGADRIVFGAGIAPADLRFANNPADATEIVISFANAAGSITIQNQWWGDAGIEFLQFADGTVWDQAQIAAAWIAGQATSGDDTIFGSGGIDQIASGSGNDHVLAGGGDDQLSGGAGNDRLEGDSGNDTYIYNLGDGNDVIYDYNWNNDQADRIVFGAGITPANIHLANNGNGSDLVVSFDGNAGSILIQSQWQGDAGVESFEFADGTIWDQAQIAARFVADQATSGNDEIFSPFGGAVDGGAGDDTIHTGDADDVVKGGTGNDRLESGYGNDIYVYNLGDGNDTVYDYSWNNDQADRIVFGAGITPANIHLDNSGNGGDLLITFDGQPGSILVQSQWQGDAGVEYIEFADGTIWDQAQIAARFVADQATSGNDDIFGTPFGGAIGGGAGDDHIRTGDADDVITGGTGNDRLESGYGNDVYVYNLGDGNDTIYDYSWNNDQADRIVFGAGIAPDDVLIDTQASGSLRVTFKHADGSITVENQNWGDAGVEFFDFTDGTTWDLSQINAHIGGATSGNDTLTADPARQEIWALEGNDRMDGSAAADSLHGQAGADALYGRGGNDIVDGGSDDDDLFGDDDPAAILTPIGDDLIVNGSFESGTVVGGGGWGNSVSDMTGWTRANTQSYEQVSSGFAGISATDGAFWLDMDAGGGSGSNMDISQTIAGLSAGETYLLEFDTANRTGADNGGIDVYWNGTLVGSFTDPYSSVHTIALDLIAGTGDNVLNFKGTGWEDNTGASLDNVRLHATVAAGLFGGDDILTGGAGDDQIDGGLGSDIAIYIGYSTDYTVTANQDGSYSVEDLVADRDGHDTLSGVETLRFADGDYAPDDLLLGNRQSTQGFSDYRSLVFDGLQDEASGGNTGGRSTHPMVYLRALVGLGFVDEQPGGWIPAVGGRLGGIPGAGRLAFDPPRLVFAIDSLSQNSASVPSVSAAASALVQSIASFGVTQAGEIVFGQADDADKSDLWLAHHKSQIGSIQPFNMAA